MDANDNGIADEDPEEVTEILHAVLTGDYMYSDKWRVTALSETVYRGMKAWLALGVTSDEIFAEVDIWAPLVVEDITGDGLVDHLDLLAWDPALHSTKVDFDTIDTTFHDERVLSHNDVLNQISSISTHYTTSSLANSLRYYKGYVFIGTNEGLEIVDVRDPLKPIRKTIFWTGFVHSMEIHENRLFISTGYSGIHILDLENISEGRFDIIETLDNKYVRLANIDSMNSNTIWSAGHQGKALGMWVTALSYDPFVHPFDGFDLDIFGNPDEAISESPNAFYVKPDNIAAFVSFETFGNLGFMGFLSFNVAEIHIIDFDNTIPRVRGKIMIRGAFESNLRLIQDVELVGDTLYASVVYGSLDKSVIELKLLAFDVSDVDNPRQLSHVPELPVRAYRSIDGGSYTWEENKLIRRDNNFIEVASVELPTILPDSSDDLRSSAFVMIVSSVDYLHGGTQAQIDYAIETFKVQARGDRAYNFSARLELNGKYAYIAAGKYGLLIYGLP